jgi:polar amino acid transport system substrate-binding protein
MSHQLRQAKTPPWRDRVVFAYIDEPPFAKPGPHGIAVGCDIDLALTVLHDIGVIEVVLRLSTFEELLAGVARGRWTMNTPLFVTPERANSVSFSRPVWALGDGFIVRTEDAEKIRSYGTVAANRWRLGVVSGQVQSETAAAAGVSTRRIQAFKTQRTAVEALLTGRIDAYASTALGNETFVRELGNPALASVAAQGPTSGAHSLGAFSFSRQSADLRRAVDAHLVEYLGSPAHRKRMAAFGLSAREIDPIVAARAGNADA